jgi:hypothetical protein
MFRKPILTAFTVSVIGAGFLTGIPAKADGIVSFDIGDEHYCIGMWSCLFKPKTYGDRDSKKTKDHRTNTTDHRDVEERKNTVVVVKPKVRDHRTKITVRDHRN